MSTHPLADTAWAVRNLVRSVGVAREWLRQRCRDYLDAREKSPGRLCPIDLLGDPEELGLADEEAEAQDAGLTLNEKAALLVALHDEVCVGEEKLAPAVRLLDTSEIASAENKSVMRWEALRRTVKDQLGDGYRHHAQNWLADVRLALCAADAARSAGLILPPSEATPEEVAAPQPPETNTAHRLLTGNDPLPHPHPDGPDQPCWLWWANVRHELTPRLWQILAYLWDHDNVPVEDLVSHVWGEEGEEAKDSTVRSNLSQLNARLNEIGVPRQYRLRRGHICCD